MAPAVQDGVGGPRQLAQHPLGERAHELRCLASSRRACSHSSQKGTPLSAADFSAEAWAAATCAAASEPEGGDRSAAAGGAASSFLEICASSGASIPWDGCTKTMILPPIVLPSSLGRYFGMAAPRQTASRKTFQSDPVMSMPRPSDPRAALGSGATR